MGSFWKQALTKLDEQLALAHLALVPERPALSVFMFHALFEHEAAMALNQVDPQQRITVRIFEEFVAYFQAHGYTFVTPADILGSLIPTKKYACITFDDGYYNNLLALPILRKYGVPATFFIATHHVQTGTAFWWDVVYRARQLQPLPEADQQAEYALLKQLRHDEVEEYLLTYFGSTALQPLGDLDRPFTTAELAAFASEPEVVLGNHTAHHAVLTNYSPTGAGQEIADSQEFLAQLTGTAPSAIAYPNGNISPAVVAVAKDAGLHLGTTVQPGKNYLPFAQHEVDILALNRFLLWGDREVARQCALFRTDFQLKRLLRSLRP
jgi:peptidoglycan/xylan/chitin deacetylase (PgdA/CDA1 family)